jgi:hypothetical protein
MSGIDGAPQARDNERIKLRLARDGQSYSRLYSEIWGEASEDTHPCNASALQPSDNASALQPSDCSANELSLVQDRASQAIAAIADETTTDGHAGVDFYDANDGQLNGDEGATGSMGPTPDAAQLGDTPCVLTKAQVANFLPTVGAKAAVMECRRLRKWCLHQVPVVNKVLMTHAAFEWQCLLRSLHKPLLEKVFGTAHGITEFNFLLLRNCKDHNYDGPRHVFEILRTDGVACHIHFHANGKPDAPVFLQHGDKSLTGNRVRTAEHHATLTP